MNIHDVKFIIGTGCSYGEMLNSIHYKKNNLDFEYFNDKLDKEIKEKNIKTFSKLEKNLIFINVPVSSQGSSWQSDSLIYVISNLLKIGIKSKNIYSLVEWSQWSRYSNTIPEFIKPSLNFSYLNENTFGFNRDTFFVKDFNNSNTKLIEYIKNLLKEIKYTQSVIGNFGIINDYYYISSDHLNTNSIKKTIGIEWESVFEKISKHDKEIFTEIKIKSYLENILKTQNFLKLNNINYNFFHMQSCFSGWTNDGIIKHYITHVDYNKSLSKTLEEYKTGDYKNKNLESVFPQFKYLIDLIDFNKFWYYESDTFSRGGIDEYSMDNYGETACININQNNIDIVNNELLDHNIILNSNFGLHPVNIIYKSLWNDITKDCNFLKFTNEYSEFIKEKIKEDINSDKITENGFLISKKYFKKSLKRIL